MQLSHILCTVVAVAISANAAAVEHVNELSKRGCQITVCKGEGKTDCAPPFDPYSDCEALASKDGRPFISGFASPGCRCEVYENKDCSYFWNGGKWEYVDESGWSRFPFEAKGVRCQ